jgi:hypothetical protein
MVPSTKVVLLTTLVLYPIEDADVNPLSAHAPTHRLHPPLLPIRYPRFQYTTDGVSWISGPQLVAPGGDQWWSGQEISNPRGDNRFFVDLSGDSAVNNNPNFAFRILAEFALGDNNYHGARDGNADGYRTAGTLRYDRVEVQGVPEPASMLASGWRVWSGCAAARRSK